MNNSLPVSRQVRVSVVLTPAGAQAQNLSTLLILGSSGAIDSVERLRTYSSIDAIASDFGATAPEYKAALLWFEQSPQPTSLKIGRWFKTAAPGVLRGAPLLAAQRALSVFTAITAGGFTVSIDGAAQTVDDVNLSAALSLNHVASLITAALTGATMTWDEYNGRFTLTSNTTGAASSVSFMTPVTGTTNLGAALGMLSTSSGAYIAPGAAAEEAIDAVTLFDGQFGQTWYAVTVLGADNDDHLAIAPYIEATNNKHLYGVSTQEAGALVAAAQSDIAYQLAAASYDKTLVCYSSTSPYSVVSLLGRLLTVDYSGNSTAITLAYKQAPGIVPEYLNGAQADALEAKNCNALLQFNNDTAIILNGVVSSGEFADVITSTDALAVNLMTSAYNLLYTSTTKIPQTDAGIHLIVTTLEAVCSQFVTNGTLAPGVWNAGGFGTLKQGDFLVKGFYIYATPLAAQNPADRAARKAPPIRIAAKLAGAVHDIDIAVSVNQ